MIALFSALEEEIRDFKKEVIVSKVSSYRCCRIYQGKCRSRDCLMVLTGMGTEHAKQVAQMIIATYPVRVLISTGFGGSLNKQTKDGDIVIYKKLFTDNQTFN